ncbi:transposase [Treponema endosymbiont of Eucomonympha sp.]|uniref:transposase n=1 Tax=Treponema endosymbiont of Eucomonympha sp. TaxID=1580831 RepID=UPI000A698832|nr:transposase [Treponema endosymbiont of Eucomonympha sp.]
MAVDEYGIPASSIVTSGTDADCNQVLLLMEGLEVEAFLADKAYDTNELLDMLKVADIAAVVTPVKSRKKQSAYSHELYRARHVIEDVFRALKRRRGTATCYAKLTASWHRRHSCQVRVPLPLSSHYLEPRRPTLTASSMRYGTHSSSATP